MMCCVIGHVSGPISLGHFQPSVGFVVQKRVVTVFIWSFVFYSEGFFLLVLSFVSENGCLNQFFSFSRADPILSYIEAALQGCSSGFFSSSCELSKALVYSFIDHFCQDALFSSFKDENDV